MSPELFLQLHKRGIAFDRSPGAREPAHHTSRCAVQRIRPGCPVFRSGQQAQRAAPPKPTPWRHWLRRLRRALAP